MNNPRCAVSKRCSQKSYPIFDMATILKLSCMPLHYKISYEASISCAQQHIVYQGVDKVSTFEASELNEQKFGMQFSSYLEKMAIFPCNTLV